MSKKHKKDQTVSNSQSSNTGMHAAEYRIIKHDLFKVLYLNIVYLALVLVVYFTNNQSHYLDRWFGKIFHF